MTQRYDLEYISRGYGGDSEMRPYEYGDWLRFEDHEAALAAAVEAERERAAKVVERHAVKWRNRDDALDHEDRVRTELAAAIRAAPAPERAEQEERQLECEACGEPCEDRYGCAVCARMVCAGCVQVTGPLAEPVCIDCEVPHAD